MVCSYSNMAVCKSAKACVGVYDGRLHPAGYYNLRDGRYVYERPSGSKTTAKSNTNANRAIRHVKYL